MKSQLRLKKETLARLQDHQLDAVDGGATPATSRLDPPEGIAANTVSCCQKTCGGSPDGDGS